MQKGMNLDAKDDNGFSDPYVVLEFQKKKKKTKVRERNKEAKKQRNKQTREKKQKGDRFFFSFSPSFSPFKNNKKIIKKNLNPIFGEQFEFGFAMNSSPILHVVVCICFIFFSSFFLLLLILFPLPSSSSLFSQVYGS